MALRTTSQTGEHVDPITSEVVRMALDAIVDEMATTLMRTSGSPGLTDAMDFSCCLLNADGEVLSYPGYVTLHVAPARIATRLIVEQFGSEGIKPGDVFLCNDAHITGNMHANDWGVVTPIFHGERIVAFGWSEAHQLDTGGAVPGSFCVGVGDAYGEAIRIPPLKIVSEGTRNTELEALILHNVRLPVVCGNDLRSLIAAGRVALDRIQQMAERYGADEFEAITQHLFDLSEKLTRERIAAIPNGVFEATDWMEHNGRRNDLYQQRGRLEVHDDWLEFYFTGDPQTDGLVNAHRGSLEGSVWVILMQMLLWDIPFNEGCMRCATVDGEKGTVVNAVHPAPVSASHMEGGIKISKLTSEMLSEALSRSELEELRTRVAGQFNESWNVASFGCIDQHGNPSVFLNMDGGSPGGGAQATCDGLDASGLSCQVNNSLPDVELNEHTYPVLFLYRRLWQNSGGPGRQRGGLGVEAAWTPWGTDLMTGSLNAAVAQVPARGCMGGYPGSTSAFLHGRGLAERAAFEAGSIPTADVLLDSSDVKPLKLSELTVKPGDVFIYRNGGGGGLEDPLDRPAEAVAADVRDGYVTVEHARVAYGVEIIGSGRSAAVDATATQNRRTEIRRERRDRMAAAGSGPVRSEVADRMGTLGMYALGRADPSVELVEWFDSDTGTCIRTQCVPEGYTSTPEASTS